MSTLRVRPRNVRKGLASPFLVSLLFALAALVTYGAKPGVATAQPLPEEEQEIIPDPLENPEQYAEWKRGVSGEQSPSKGLRLRAQSSGGFSNGSINGYINSNGQFTIGTAFDERLLYGHPGGETSETLIRIDGKEYWFHEHVGSVVVDDDSATATAVIDGLEIKQEITFKKNKGDDKTTSKDMGSAVISYSCRVADVPSGSGLFYSKKVSIRIMLDTMLGENDGAPFSLTDREAAIGKQVVTETEFGRSSIPVAFQALESIDGSGLRSTGYLRYGAVKPAKVQFASWRDINGAPWNYKIEKNRSITGDSAVAVYFDDVDVNAHDPSYVKLGETKYGCYSHYSSDAKAFDYDLNTYQRDLAVECAKYAALAYGGYRYDSLYGGDGCFYDSGYDTTGYFRAFADKNGYSDIQDNVSESKRKQKNDKNEHTSTYFLAHRPVIRNGEIRELVMVAIRGTYKLEWKGNFQVTGDKYDPTQDYHKSFKLAAEDTKNALEDYISECAHTDNALVMVCGHSRGAAIGNLLAEELNKGEVNGVDPEGVCAYLFATPNTTMYPTGYNNIYNFCFADDFVPNMPFTFWSKVEETDTSCILRSFGKNGIIRSTVAENIKLNGIFGSYERRSTQLSEGRNPSFDSTATKKVLSYIQSFENRELSLSDLITSVKWSGLEGYYTPFTHTSIRFKPYNPLDPMNHYSITVDRESLYGFMHNTVAEAAMNEMWDSLALLARECSVDSFRQIACYFVDGFGPRKSVNDTHQMYTYYNALTSGAFDGGSKGGENKGSSGNGYASDRQRGSLSLMAMADENGDDISQIDAAEYAAVNAIVSSNIERLSAVGWSPDNPSTWTGFEVRDGHVSEVCLSGLGLTGALDLSAFTQLQTAMVDYNELTSLTLPPVEGSQLSWLTCSDNKLTALDFEGHPLQTLDCSMNYLDVALVEPTADGIETVSYREQKVPADAVYSSDDANWLASHVLSNAEIWGQDDSPSTWYGVTWEPIDGVYRVTGLGIGGCNLSGTIDVSGLSCLTRLDCANNSLEALIASGCNDLTYINCSDNQIGVLNVSGLALDALYCSNNVLSRALVDGLQAKTLEAGHQRVAASSSAFSADELAVLADVAFALEEDVDDPGSWDFVEWGLGNDGFYHASSIEVQGDCVQGDLDLSSFSELQSVNLSSSGVSSVILPDSLAAIDDYAFYDCGQLVSIELPASVSVIGEGAFAYCDALKMAVLPNGLTEIGRKAFAGCTSLESIYATGNAPTIGEDAFAGTPAALAIHFFEGSNGWEEANGEDCIFVLSDRLCVTSLPARIYYEAGETLDLEGLALILVHEDGTYDSITEGYALGNVSLDAPGNHAVVVTYGGESTELDVLVATLELSYCYLEFEGGDRFELTDGTVEPRVVVHDPDRGVVSEEDYDLEFFDNDHMGIASVTVTGKNKYSGSLSESFSIYEKHVVDSVDGLESKHDYDDHSDCEWVYTTSYPSGGVLHIVFDEQTEFEDGYDYLTIADAEGNQIGRYTGTQLAGKTIYIAGNELKLWLTSDGSTTRWGFKVTSVSSGGLPPLEATASTTPVASDETAVFSCAVDGAVNADLSYQWQCSNDAETWQDLSPLLWPTASTEMLEMEATPERVGTQSYRCIVTASDGRTAATEAIRFEAAFSVTVVTDLGQFHSPHPYGDRCSDSWVYTAADMDKLEVLFDERTSVEGGCDSICIYDGDGNWIGSYTGTELAGQVVEVPGDTVRVKLVTDGSITQWGFAVVSVCREEFDLTRDGWITFANGDKGYVRNGALVKGWMDLGSSKYWFRESGRMATGWTDVEVNGSVMHYYFNPTSGNLVRDTWFDIDGEKYYFRPSGNMATGWADIDGRKYYLDESGHMLTGWQSIEVSDGEWREYYFRESGSMATGFADIDGTKWLFTASGTKAVGWADWEGGKYWQDEWEGLYMGRWLDNGQGTYYLRPSGKMATGWATIDGEKFYFRPSGNMATGFADVDDAYKRYFDADGHMLTGWQQIGSNTYYFRASGAMQTGSATIDGKSYTFTDKGVLVGTRAGSGAGAAPLDVEGVFADTAADVEAPAEPEAAELGADPAGSLLVDLGAMPADGQDGAATEATNDLAVVLESAGDANEAEATSDDGAIELVTEL